MAAAKTATAAATAPAKAKRIKVRALMTVFYDNKRFRTGDVFRVSENDFSGRSMELVDRATPEHVSTGNDQLRAEYDAIRASKVSNGAAGDDDDDVI
jgi:hypothetical protein